MTGILEYHAQDSELLALRLQEQELQAQQDALFAQHMALAYASRQASDDDDIETVMELNTNQCIAAELKQLQSQLSEIRSRQGRLAAKNVHVEIAEQAKMAQESLAVAEMYLERDRWHQTIRLHDAAFARKLASVNKRAWLAMGDKIEEPLHLPPPPNLPEGAGAPAEIKQQSCLTSVDDRYRLKRRHEDMARPGPTQRQDDKQPSALDAGRSASGGNRIHSGAGAITKCLRCNGRFPEHAVTCAGAEGASTSSASAGCGHFFCSTCMSEYVRGAVRERKYPVLCPVGASRGVQGSCKMRLSREAAMLALATRPQEMEAYRQLEACSGTRHVATNNPCGMPPPTKRSRLDGDGAHSFPGASAFPNSMPSTCVANTDAQCNTTAVNGATAQTKPPSLSNVVSGPSKPRHHVGSKVDTILSSLQTTPSIISANKPTTNGQPTSSAVKTAPVATVECLSCFDCVPGHSAVCAGADAASTSSSSAGCGHYFCAGCMSEYVRGAVRERKYPVLCPMASGGGCQNAYSRAGVLAALSKHPNEQQAYRLLEAQAALDPRKVVYCPHKACSSPLELPDDLPPDQPTTCPACGKGFCPRCRIPGWHQGYTCAAFQQLPAHLRSAEDAAVLQLSAKQQWKRCPQCTMVVERSEGCNHMSCHCGAAFCYACGKAYRSKTPTADNVHGTPACGCPLFDVPMDDAAEVAPPPPQPRQQRRRFYNPEPAPAPAARPVRGGRVVSRRPCRYSASIFDCPHGPNMCWFWHVEDDEAQRGAARHDQDDKYDEDDSSDGGQEDEDSEYGQRYDYPDDYHGGYYDDDGYGGYDFYDGRRGCGSYDGLIDDSYDGY